MNTFVIALALGYIAGMVTKIYKELSEQNRLLKKLAGEESKLCERLGHDN